MPNVESHRPPEAPDLAEPDAASKRIRFPNREARKLETRERILSAAVDCFRAVGYRTATVDQIAQRAGANRATFYRHFAGKGELVQGILGELQVDGAALMRELDAMHNPSVGQLTDWVIKVRAMYESHSAVIDALESALSSEPEVALHYVELANGAPGVMTRYLSGFEATARDEAQRRMVLVFLLLDRFFFYGTLRRTPIGSDSMTITVARAIRQMLFNAAPDERTSSRPPSRGTTLPATPRQRTSKRT
jgi:AcrR family transcriptional regulator